MASSSINRFTLTKPVEVQKSIEFDFLLGDGELLAKFPSRKKAEEALELFFYEFCQWAKNFNCKCVWLTFPGSFKSDDNKGFCCAASFCESKESSNG